MNPVSIVEIPVANLARAVGFYQTILGVTLDEVPMGDTVMALFPGDPEAVALALVQGPDHKPSSAGAVVYLNAGNDLRPVLERIVAQGGKVTVPKTEISPEMGFFAWFVDSEGNQLGLHSMG